MMEIHQTQSAVSSSLRRAALGQLAEEYLSSLPREAVAQEVRSQAETLVEEIWAILEDPALVFWRTRPWTTRPASRRSRPSSRRTTGGWGCAPPVTGRWSEGQVSTGADESGPFPMGRGRFYDFFGENSPSIPWTNRSRRSWTPGADRASPGALAVSSRANLGGR